MKKLHLLYIASTFLLGGLTSCEDMLTEKPDSAYEKDEYFDSESKAEMMPPMISSSPVLSMNWILRAYIRLCMKM